MIKPCAAFGTKIAAKFPSVPRSYEVGRLNARQFQGAAVEHGGHAKGAAGLGLADRAVAGVGQDRVRGQDVFDRAALTSALVLRRHR